MDSKDVVKEAARIIYLVHDELKDKQFELEMSWVGKHTFGKHEQIPLDIKSDAETKACQSLVDDSDSDTEEV
jgi:20S proteasome subunit alpha 7